jgi:NADH dehydrogenase
MIQTESKSKKRVIIAGGGFAGLQLAKKLNHTEFDVLLIDKQNHHQFQPLFYQVASSRLEPSTISFPFRKIFQKYSNLNFILGEITEINPDENAVVTNRGKLFYDYLIIATGCDTNYFGNEDIRKYCLPMKTTGEAIEIRNRILLGFEDLFSLSDADNRARLNHGGGTCRRLCRNEKKHPAKGLPWYRLF